MDPALFDLIDHTLTSDGPVPAIDRLCDELRQRKDYHALFYALLLKKRVDLGISPVPTGASADVPAEHQEAYEDAIRHAGRLVGGLYLDEGNIPQAWMYFRMLGESEPVARALDAVKPAEGEDCQPLVEIAFHQGVRPVAGFRLLLDRYGLCSAVTTLGNRDVPLREEDRVECTKILVRALYAELVERLKTEITRHEGAAPPSDSVAALIEAREWLFAEDSYHIDVSHLGSVVQLSLSLPACQEARMARELCSYGRRLSSRFRYPGEPPFEDQYADSDRYLGVILGEDVDGNLAHFRTQAAADPETIGTFPAEVLVNLLLKIGRTGEALEAAIKYLAEADDRRLSCPRIPELCEKAGNYEALSRVARDRGDAVHFLAGRLAARGK